MRINIQNVSKTSCLGKDSGIVFETSHSTDIDYRVKKLILFLNLNSVEPIWFSGQNAQLRSVMEARWVTSGRSHIVHLTHLTDPVTE